MGQLNQFEINLLIGCISVMGFFIASIAAWIWNRATKTIDSLQSQVSAMNLQFAALPGQYVSRMDHESKIDKIFVAIDELKKMFMKV